MDGPRDEGLLLIAHAGEGLVLQCQALELLLLLGQQAPLLQLGGAGLLRLRRARRLRMPTAFSFSRSISGPVARSLQIM